MSEQPVEVRVATWDDRVALAALRREWTAENRLAAGQDGPVEDDGFQARFDAWLEREQHQRVTWLGWVDGEAVGMLNLLTFTRMPRPGETAPNQWGYLANCYVRPRHRGTGLGSRLLAACTAYADEHSFVRIVLSPTARSVPFYARSGFERATSLLVRSPPAS